MTSKSELKLPRELREALDPFMRVYRLSKQARDMLGKDDDPPLREILPGVWPTWSELKRLHDAVAGSP